MARTDSKPQDPVDDSSPVEEPADSPEPDSLLARMRALQERINPRDPPTLVAAGTAADAHAAAASQAGAPASDDGYEAAAGPVGGPHKFQEPSIGLAFEQKRRSVRNRCLRSAKVVFHDRRYQVDCQVRDESRSGMKLRLLGDVSVPDQFELLIESKEELLPVAVRWRHELELGVEVTGEPVPLPRRMIMDTSRRR